MPETDINKEKRQKIIQNYILRMPSFSTTVAKVLEVCNSPKTSPNELNKVISLDPVLTGKVLTLINSAYYSLPKKVSSLTRAIIMLGINTVKNLALSTAIMGSVGGKGSFHALDTDDFWTHSICTGVTSKILAASIGVPAAEREEYFVAGLLHDLGKIPLNNRFPDEYTQALEMANAKQISLYQAEDLTLGINHCLTGKMIAEKWKLSETLGDAIYFHHSPGDVCEENKQVTTLVTISNIYANILEMGSSQGLYTDKEILTNLFDSVGIDWTTLSDIRDNVIDEIEKAKIFLEVSDKG